MKRVLSILLVSFLLFLVAVDCSSAAPASTPDAATGWVPTKNIVCIIPFAPGGGSDVLTRTMIEYLDLPAGVNIVLTYQDGGAGAIGARQAAEAKPDGYTILAHNTSNIVSQGVSEVNNLWENLVFLSGVVNDWTTVCTNKATGWKTLDDVIAYAKAHPGEIKFGTTGSTGHMSILAKLNELLGIDTTIVPYDGGADSRAALLGNHIQLELTQSSDAQAYVKAGDVIPLWVFDRNRCPLFPDAPAIVERGYDIVLSAPRAYYAPSGMDPAVIDYYEDLIKKVCAKQEFIDKCAALGYIVNFIGHEEGTQLTKEMYKTAKAAFEDKK